MGFLLLLFTTLFALQFAEARVLEHHFHNAALPQHNSAHLDAVAVAVAGGHVTNFKESESNPGSNSENSTQDVNTIATPGVGSRSKVPEGIEEVAPIEGNADILHEMLNSHSSPGVGHMSVNDGIESNILSSSGKSPGVGHWEKSKTKYSTSPAKTTPNTVLSSGPSPGVGNAHTSAIAGTQSELGTFNKLPSGPSPGVGHKVTNDYTEMAQESESKKSSMMMNILPSGPSPGVGNSATNGRNSMEEDKEGMGIQTFNKLPSGPSPGVGHSYTNAEKLQSASEDRKGSDSIPIFQKLPGGPSPGVGHSYTNAYQPEKLQSASENRKGSDNIPIFQKLPGGPSPGGGNSYVEKSASTVRMQLSPNAVIKTSSSPSPGDGNSSINKSKPSRRQKKKVEQIAEALDRKIGCDAASYMDRLSDKTQFFEGSNFYGNPTSAMFGIAAGRDARTSKF